MSFFKKTLAFFYNVWYYVLAVCKKDIICDFIFRIGGAENGKV